MKTVLDVIKSSTEYLEKNGVAAARLQAEEFIGAALHIKRLDLYLAFDRPLSEEELTVCRQYLKRRTQKEPLQYIVGDVDFYNCLIKVNPHVIIPRPETEQLVEKIAQELQGENVKGKHLWDLCCGSGCMGIALKKLFPELSVTLADISKEALDVAQANAALNDVEVNCVQGDLLTPFVEKKAHFVVCNPPYISEKDYQNLEPEVRDYEPKHALVAADRGLVFYKRLSTELKEYLYPNAKIWFEIGYNQGQTVKELFEKSPWQHCSLDKDYAGYDRFITAEMD